MLAWGGVRSALLALQLTQAVATFSQQVTGSQWLPTLTLPRSLAWARGTTWSIRQLGQIRAGRWAAAGESRSTDSRRHRGPARWHG